MENYLDIANSGYFYLWGGVILAVIMLQSFLFIRISWKEGKRIGLTSQRMLRGLRAGMISAILPSIAIVLFLVSMAPKLGIPFPWIRLSVIGSGPYELLAAGLGAKTMGLNGLKDAGYNAPVFANSVWVMTFGAMWSGLMVLFFVKLLGRKYKKLTAKDPKLLPIISNSAFLGVVCVFMGDQMLAGTLEFLTLITGGLLMTVFAILITKFKFTRLTEFALPISMLTAMASAIFYAQWLA